MAETFIDSSAFVEDSAIVGEGTKIWRWSHVGKAVIGANVTVGERVYIGTGVVIGDKTKIQNNCQIYEGTRVDSGVFIGPGVICTNDKFPRSVDVKNRKKATTDWDQVSVVILEGASIGAGSICIAPLRIGCWAMVGAGSVVTRDVPDYALVFGNPARFISWVGRAGYPLIRISEGRFICPKTRENYRVTKPGRLELH